MSGDGPYYTTRPGAGWHQFYDSYNTLEQRIEQQAERIAQLEAALVEERANSIYAVAPHEMEYCIVLAREQLEELGILTKLQNGAI